LNSLTRQLWRCQKSRPEQGDTLSLVIYCQKTRTIACLNLKDFQKEIYMTLMNVFKTTTTEASPLDASTGTDVKPAVSDFITVQSFTNFAAMTGAITAAWHALQRLSPVAAAIWVPYLFAFAWAIISILISIDGLKKTNGGQKRLELGTILGAVFVALINSLVLAGAVVGTGIATGQTP
jgi:hypothetical protein